MSRGFTLLEGVIAITILGLIGALTFGTFARAMDARERAESINERYRQLRQAMLRMAREIQMAYVSEHRDCDDPHTKTLFRGKRKSGGSRLDFTSFSHYKLQADADESDQNELSYFVDADPDHPSDTALFRREQNRIDDEPDEGGQQQMLAEKVTELSFEFYDDKEDRWEDEWDTENSDFKGRLPMFVAIHLKAKGPSGKDEEFVTKTRTFVRKSVRILGTGFAACLD